MGKRKIIGILTVLLALTLCACGKKDEGSTVEKPSKEATENEYSDIETPFKQTGLNKLEEMLYQNDDDRKYLTPSCEDYRVDIIDTKAIIFESCSLLQKPGGGEWVFGTDPMGKTTLKPCKIYRIYEYNDVGSLVSYKEKTVFENEGDAIHVAGTNGINGNHALYFIDWLGVNEVPADFTEEQGLRVICDEYLPAYYRILGGEEGYQADIVRTDNTFYSSFVLDNAGFINQDYFGGICEVEFLGDYLKTEGVEFSADNVDDEGFIYLNDGENSMTVYYSDPDAHKHNISTAEDNGGNLPDDFVVMKYDDQYFSPASDDYIIFYTMFEDYGDYCFNEQAALLSFDAAGNLIDAKYRYFRASNLVNPMSECIDSILLNEGSKLLYSDDTYAYFDVLDVGEFREYLGDGKYGDKTFTKAEILEQSVDENFVKVPIYGWASDNGIFISK
jgi:hypothetical protein